MSILKSKKDASAGKDSGKAESLATALDIQKHTRSKKMGSKSDQVHPAELMLDDERASSIADAIMKKRAVRKMAEGGMVDLEENNEEAPSGLDEFNVAAVQEGESPAPFLKENYGEEDLMTRVKNRLKRMKAD